MRYYELEQKFFKPETEIYVSNENALKIIRKLIRHFKIENMIIIYTGKLHKIQQTESSHSFTFIKQNENELKDNTKYFIVRFSSRFKIYKTKIYPSGNRGWMRISKNPILTLSIYPSINVICHELAHFLSELKNKSMRHNLKMLKQQKRMINYVRKKHYWGMTISENERNKLLKL